MFINNRPSVSVRGSYSSTLLHWAALYGLSDAVQVFIDAKASLDVLDSGGYTPMHCAVYDDHSGAVRVLIASGASITICESDIPRTHPELLSN